MHRLCALIRAEARGESGTLIAWTPSRARSLAPSSSLAAEIPRGETISTSVTNSPLATSRPIFERSAKGAGGVSVTIGSRVPPFAGLFCACTARIADFIARIWFGVVPQHPPRNWTPAFRNFLEKFAIYSGEHR